MRFVSTSQATPELTEEDFFFYGTYSEKKIRWEGLREGRVVRIHGTGYLEIPGIGLPNRTIPNIIIFFLFPLFSYLIQPKDD